VLCDHCDDHNVVDDEAYVNDVTLNLAVVTAVVEFPSCFSSEAE